MDTTRISKGILEVQNHVRDGFKDLGKDLLSGFTAAGIIAKTEELFGKVQDIKRTAAITGTDVEGIQKFDYAATQTGVNVDTANSALEKLNVNIGKAREEGGKAAETFERWGISLDGSNEEIVSAIADKMKSMPDPAQRAAMAVDLMGRSGKDLIPLLERGAAAMTAMGNHAPLLSDKDVENIEQAHRTIEDANNRLTIWGGKLLSMWSNFASDLGRVSVGDFGQVADPEVVRKKFEAWQAQQDAFVNGNHPAGLPGTVTTPAENDAALDALDKINEKRYETIEKISGQIADQNRTILDTQTEINNLQDDGNESLRHRHELMLRIAVAQQKVVELTAKQKEMDLQATTLSNRIKENEDRIRSRGFEAPTIEDLSGRKWFKSFSAQYGAGGRFDLGRGEGPFAEIAREYERARYQQMYDRKYGNLGQADLDRRRMNAAQDQLIAAGVASPAMQMEKLIDETSAMRVHLANIIAGGAVINTRIKDE